MRSSGLRLARRWLLVASSSSQALAASAGAAGASASAGRETRRTRRTARMRGIAPRLYRALALHPAEPGVPARKNCLDLDRRAARSGVAEPVRRGVRQIDEAIGMERAAVVDAHDDAPPVGQIGDAGVARYRQDRVRRGHGVHVVALSAR